MQTRKGYYVEEQDDEDFLRKEMRELKGRDLRKGVWFAFLRGRS